MVTVLSIEKRNAEMAMLEITRNHILISNINETLSYLPQSTSSLCLFLHLLLFLWQRELHSRLAFLHEQLCFVQSLLQLQLTIPCPPTLDT